MKANRDWRKAKRLPATTESDPEGRFENLANKSG